MRRLRLLLVPCALFAATPPARGGTVEVLVREASERPRAAPGARA